MVSQPNEVIRIPPEATCDDQHKSLLHRVIDTVMTAFAVLQDVSRVTMTELCSGPLIDVSHEASMVENLDIKAARNGGRKGGLRLSFGGLLKTSRKCVQLELS